MKSKIKKKRNYKKIEKEKNEKVIKKNNNLYILCFFQQIYKIWI